MRAMTRSAFIGVSVVAFVAGAATTWLMSQPEVTPLSTASPTSITPDMAGLSSRLEAIDRRLSEIEASLNAVDDTGSFSSPSLPRVTRTNDQSLDEIRAQLESLLNEMRARMAGLGELQAMKPQPDTKALDELRARCGSEPKLVQASFLGMTYRDVVLQFGSPTIKFPAVNVPTNTHPEIWLWESPAGDLHVTFANGAAVEAALHQSGVMRKFLEDLEQR
jgi:hypothetical protein